MCSSVNVKIFLRSQVLIIESFRVVILTSFFVIRFNGATRHTTDFRHYRLDMRSSPTRIRLPLESTKPEIARDNATRPGHITERVFVYERRELFNYFQSFESCCDYCCFLRQKLQKAQLAPNKTPSTSMLDTKLSPSRAYLPPTPILWRNRVKTSSRTRCRTQGSKARSRYRTLVRL